MLGEYQTSFVFFFRGVSPGRLMVLRTAGVRCAQALRALRDILWVMQPVTDEKGTTIMFLV